MSVPQESPATRMSGDTRTGIGESGPWSFVGLLVAHRKRLIQYPLLISLAVVLLSFLFPNTYRSQVTILPPERNFQSMTEVMSGLPPGMFGSEMALPFMATPSDILAAVLTSQTVRDAVTSRERLAARWDVPAGLASSQLLTRTIVRVRPTGIIDVMYDDHDRHFADTLVNSLVASADLINQEIANTKARRTREFVEGRLAETTVQLDSAAAALERFQNTHRTIALDAEVTALVENAARLRAQITSDQIELSVLEESLAPEHPRVRALRTRINETTRSLRDWEASRSHDSTRSFLGMGLSEVPQLAQELATLIRDVRVAETLYELLAQQYEHARIQERRDTPTFSVLDWAVHGGRKVAPRRSLVGLMTFAAMFALVLAFFLGQMYVYRLAANRPERYRIVVGLWEEIRPRRKRDTS